MSSGNIPTDEDFARARAAMQERDRGLSEVRSRVLERFAEVGLHQIFVLYSADNDLFVTYLFFLDQKQLVHGEQSGLVDQIRSSVLDELEDVGRGERSQLNVKFELDTDESVQRDFDGDYYARLR